MIIIITRQRQSQRAHIKVRCTQHPHKRAVGAVGSQIFIDFSITLFTEPSSWASRTMTFPRRAMASIPARPSRPSPPLPVWWAAPRLAPPLSGLSTTSRRAHRSRRWRSEWFASPLPSSRAFASTLRRRRYAILLSYVSHTWCTHVHFFHFKVFFCVPMSYDWLPSRGSCRLGRQLSCRIRMCMRVLPSPRRPTPTPKSKMEFVSIYVTIST